MIGQTPNENLIFQRIASVIEGNPRQAERLKNTGQFILEYLKTIFGKQISQLEGILPEDLRIDSGEKGIPQERPNYTSILQGFYKHALDSGLLKPREFIFQNKTIREDSLPMLCRSAFIHKVGEDLSQETSPQGVFLMVDLADLRSSDLAVDEEGNSAGDITINRAARAIEDVVDQFKDAFGQNSVKITAGRYGGDEFIISLIGKITTEEEERFKTELRQKIIEKKGYYKRGDAIAEESIGLKNNEVKTIFIPQDSYKQSIFLYYFNNGLVLDNEEISRICKRFKNEEEFKKYAQIRQKKPIYPPGTETVEQKMAFLKTKHHELILPLDLALYYDELEEISQETKCYPRSQDILKFIENVVYDRLLGENIQSFIDFQEYFIDGEISTVYYFDLKFIKEINDNLSYVSGDEAIMALWQKLKEATPNDMGKIMIARRGGTFLIGLRTGQELTKKTSESLLNINSILLFENDMPITVPIGQSAFQYDLSNRPSERESAWPSWVKKMIRNLSEGLNKANDYWYKQVYQVLKDSSELKQTVADSKPPPLTSDSWMSFDKLLWFYFHGKRAVERCHKMIEIIGDKDSDLKKIFEDILTLQG